MLIRPVGRADLPALETEVARARAAGEFLGSSDPEASFFMRSFEFAPHPVSGAFAEDGSLIGFVSPEFKVIVVRVADRRRGVGRALVEAGLAIERERRRPNLLMGVLPDDTDGHGFLEATGFEFHSTLWDLELPEALVVATPSWPGRIVARPFELARDGRPWVELFNASFADHATPLQIDVAALESAAADPTLEDEDTLVVEEEATGELVGFCATTPERGEGGIGPRAEIWTIGVRPDRQGKGLGRQLLRWGVQRLRSLGVAHVALSVNARNEHALGLYLSEGFAKARTRDRWARPVDLVP